MVSGACRRREICGADSVGHVSRAHREILVFASPFFEAALSGDWSETRPDARRQSMSSVITISQPPSNPADKSTRETEMTFTPTDPDMNPDDLDIEDLSLDIDSEMSERESESDSNTCVDTDTKEEKRRESLKILEGKDEKASQRKKSLSKKLKNKKASPAADAIIVLKEEKASIFHDFLKFVYPQ